MSRNLKTHKNSLTSILSNLFKTYLVNSQPKYFNYIGVILYKKNEEKTKEKIKIITSLQSWHLEMYCLFHLAELSYTTLRLSPKIDMR